MPIIDQKLQEAFALHQAGQWKQARDCFRDILKKDAHCFDAALMLGVIYGQQDQIRLAVAAFERACQIRPDAIDAQFNLGRALFLEDNYEAAIPPFDRVLAAEPFHFGALHARGVAHYECKNLAQACEDLLSAIAQDSNFAETHHQLGLTCFALDDLDRAEQAFSRCLELSPLHSQAWIGRGNVHNKRRDYHLAFEDFTRAAQLDPEDATAYFNLGGVFEERRLFEKAEEYYLKALEKSGPNFDTLMKLGNAQDKQKKYLAALATYEKATRLKPNADGLLGLRFSKKLLLCDWGDYAQLAQRCIQETLAGKSRIDPLSAMQISEDPFFLQKAAEIASPKDVEGVEHFVAKPTNSKTRIRLAFLSSDFHNHPVAALLIGLLRTLDRAQFELIGLSLESRAKDDMFLEIKELCDQFIELDDLSNLEAISQIRALDLDIAVDLNGHTANARPILFSARIAPIQVNYLGFSGTSGNTAFDYIIADSVVVTQDARSNISENLITLPHSFMPADDQRAIAQVMPSRSSQGLPDEAFVFCAFNNHAKFNPALFDRWMALLRDVPHSVLWLSSSNETTKRNLLREVKQRGIEAERLMFAGFEKDPAVHLARYRLADLYIDSLPYNAHATCCDALWAGLPVLTLPGRSFSSRVAASLVHAVGLEKFIASDVQDYHRKAVAYAGDKELQRQTRTFLDTTRSKSPLFDTKAYTRQFELAMRRIHEQRLAGLEADDMIVAGD